MFPKTGATQHFDCIHHHALRNRPSAHYWNHPGNYDIKRNGSAVCSNQVVDSNNSAYCEMLSGAITVVDTGAPPVDPVIIDSAPLTNGTVGTGYTHTFTSTGGTGTGKAWSISAGTVPPSLAMQSSSGKLGDGSGGNGTLTTSGPYSFTVTVVDDGANTASSAFTLTINSAAGVSLAGSLIRGLTRPH